MPKKKIRQRTNRNVISPDQGSQITYRVWKLDAGLKEAIAEKRQARQQTLREFVAEAVATELSDLTTQLTELGIAIEDSASVAPVRYPMAESTLKALRHASHWSGLDQSQLFVACLRLATRRKRRRTATPKN
ncbi:hypothetical protein [Symmachiella dynata]|uniref:hypothetical protein n=1 Tax=Symmachiella dynata TaxID=2527995 RepID=UPI0030EEDF85